MIDNIEPIIKLFLSLNDEEKHQVFYLIRTLNFGDESEKITVIESLGLEYCVKMNCRGIEAKDCV